jgi:predicted RecB family nuclease
MNKRPGHVEVTTEVNYCSFCDRVRNLRREEHHLGTLVRTVITCETCHRTLSSTMGVATVEAPATPEAPATSEVEGEAKPQPAKRTATRKAEPASPKPKAAKSRSTKPK